MPPQTLKRQAEDVNFNNDNIDGNEYDVAWGGTKKSRYLYSYTLQSPDLFPNINDPNQTEIEVAVEPGFSYESNCDSDCDCCVCQSCSSQSDRTELEVTNNDSFLDIDNGYAPEDILDDTQSSFPDKNVFSYFKMCLQCKEKNSNPSFQFCHKCFRYRMKLFDIKPNLQPKSIKRLNKMVNHMEEFKSRKNSEESSQESSFGLSGLYLSQESVTDKSENTVNICNICFVKPKNGIFNHGSTGHVYCCYVCSKTIWAKSGKCPICNLKIKNVTKAISF